MDQGLEHGLKPAGREAVSGGERLGCHRSAARVHGHIHDGSNGEEAFVG
jgi:hypothetical protein